MTVGGTIAARYTYDPLDRRIGIQDNGIQTWVVWDSPQPYADFNGSGTLQERYLYGPAVDEVLARTDSVGTTSWYLTDREGSIRNLADSSGTVTGTITYDGFGKVLSSSGAVDRFGYTGREYDPTTGLQYNRERYYDAALGRWTQEDKIGFAGRDPNLERYVGNSPTNASDPSGLEGEWFGPGDWLDRNFGGGAYGPPGWTGVAIGWTANIASIAPGAGEIGDIGQVALGRDFNGNAFTTADYVGTTVAASLPFIPGAFGRFAGRRLSKLGGLVPFNKLDDTIDAADDLAHNIPGPRSGGGSASRTPSANVAPSKCPAPSSGRPNPVTSAPRSAPSFKPDPKNNVTAKPRTVDEFLKDAEDFLRKGYSEGKDGAFYSADGSRRVRFTPSDLAGHNGGPPHGHFEFNGGRNIHVPLTDQ